MFFEAPCSKRLTYILTVSPTTHPELDGKNFLGNQSIWVPSSMLTCSRGHPTDCRVSDNLDELLVAASPQYEQSSQQYETYCTDEKLDELFWRHFSY